MTIEHSPKLNGYKVRSWGDIVAVATLLAMFLGVVAWGLKLEARIDAQQFIHNNDFNSINYEVRGIEVDIARGILPRAEERIKRINENDRALVLRIEKLEAEH